MNRDIKDDLYLTFSFACDRISMYADGGIQCVFAHAEEFNNAIDTIMKIRPSEVSGRWVHALCEMQACIIEAIGGQLYESLALVNENFSQ